MKVWIVEQSPRPASGYFIHNIYASKELMLDSTSEYINWSNITDGYCEGYGAGYHYVADEYDMLT